MPNYQNYLTQTYDDLKQLLHASAAKFGERACILPGDRLTEPALSYRRFCADVDALGTALLCRGWGGKRILLLGESSSAWATAYMALICGVGVVIPLDRTLRSTAIAEIAQKTDAHAVICPEARMARLREVLPSADLLALEALEAKLVDGYAHIRQGDRSYLDAEIDPKALATVVYTSGGSGKARAVMLSHKNLCSALSEICKMVYLDEDDVFLSTLPLHHIYGIVSSLLCPFYRGAAVAFCEELDRLTQTMRSVRPTVMPCIPALPEQLYRNICLGLKETGLSSRFAFQIKLTDAIPSKEARLAAKRRVFAPIHQMLGGRMRLLISGGAPINPECLRGLNALGVTAIQGYGMTESAALIAINRDTYHNANAAGLSTPHTLLDVYDPMHDGIGEIRFRGDNLMLGYLDDPHATAEMIRDGWLYTGDLGMIDDDGFLYLVGRTENIIRVKDRAVIPEALEALLVKSRSIAEVAVIADPYATKKAAPVALILPSPARLARLKKKHGPFADSALDLELRRAITEVNGIVAPHKRIRAYILLSKPLPKTASHKLVRAGLAETVRAASLKKRRV